MADLKLEIRDMGFFLEPLTDAGLAFMNYPGAQPTYKIGDQVEYQMRMQDMVVHAIEDQGLVLTY